MALTTNLVSYWKLDESSGNATDSHGSNTLTNNNSTGFTTGKINNGANLIRNNGNYFSITNASQTGLSLTGDISASFWLNPSGGMNANTVPDVFMKTNFANTGYELCLGDGGSAGSAPNLRFMFRWIINASTEKYYVTTLTTGSWYHIVITFNATSGDYKLYINDSNVDSQTFAGAPITVGTSTDSFFLGWNGASAGRYVDGITDEFGLWSRVLTSGEVTTLYNSGAGLAYASFNPPSVNSNFLAFL